ncbi:hypothetical protein [Xylophilus sp. GOD-11R]|uniref:hypothetical protein n=1 Tax=Xylophilus sp. GOD-11R TaxID=3089814 RepID=UPI00298C7E33|nr:hypothetical protein [Xylophilus sp. GOD-11R]WPB55905.1 hypothetical protein R9X41_17380 [Xylophilus sp. GOD-11R]
MRYLKLSRSDLAALGMHHVTSVEQLEIDENTVLQGTGNLVLFEKWCQDLDAAGCAYEIHHGKWPTPPGVGTSLYPKTT